jgi:hypothetical protein
LIATNTIRQLRTELANIEHFANADAKNKVLCSS